MRVIASLGVEVVSRAGHAGEGVAGIDPLPGVLTVPGPLDRGLQLGADGEQGGSEVEAQHLDPAGLHHGEGEAQAVGTGGNDLHILYQGTAPAVELLGRPGVEPGEFQGHVGGRPEQQLVESRVPPVELGPQEEGEVPRDPQRVDPGGGHLREEPLGDGVAEAQPEGAQGRVQIGVFREQGRGDVEELPRGGREKGTPRGVLVGLAPTAPVVSFHHLGDDGPLERGQQGRIVVSLLGDLGAVGLVVVEDLPQLVAGAGLDRDCGPRRGVRFPGHAQKVAAGS